MSSEVLSYIQLGTVIIVGCILFTQIRKQRTIIKNLELYINATNWKNVQEYYETFKLKEAKENTVRELIEYIKKSNWLNNVESQMNEMIIYMRFLVSRFEESEKGEGKKFVIKNLPSCVHLFEDIWADA